MVSRTTFLAKQMATKQYCAVSLHKNRKQFTIGEHKMRLRKPHPSNFLFRFQWFISFLVFFVETTFHELRSNITPTIFSALACVLRSEKTPNNEADSWLSSAGYPISFLLNFFPVSARKWISKRNQRACPLMMHHQQTSPEQLWWGRAVSHDRAPKRIKPRRNGNALLLPSGMSFHSCGSWWVMVVSGNFIVSQGMVSGDFTMRHGWHLEVRLPSTFRQCGEFANSTRGVASSLVMHPDVQVFWTSHRHTPSSSWIAQGADISCTRHAASENHFLFW